MKAGLAELEQWCCYATEEVSMFHCTYQFLVLFGILLLYFHVQFVGSAWDELKHIRQAVGFLVRTDFGALCKTNFCMIWYFYLIFFSLNFLQVIHQKPKKALHEITNELCPVRSHFSLFLLHSSHFFCIKFASFFYPSKEKKTFVSFRLLACCFNLYYSFIRCLAYSNCIGSALCTGMTNTEPTLFLQM